MFVMCRRHLLPADQVIKLMLFYNVSSKGETQIELKYTASNMYILYGKPQ